MACVCEVFGEARGARYCPNPREESGASREIGYISYIMVRLCGVVRSGDDEISVDKQLRWFNRGSSYSGMLGAQGQGYEWVCAVVFAGLCGHPRYCWFKWFWPWLWLWLAAETGRAVTSRCCSARPARAPMAAPPFQGLLTMKKKTHFQAPSLAGSWPPPWLSTPAQGYDLSRACLSFLGPRRSYYWTSCLLAS